MQLIMGYTIGAAVMAVITMAALSMGLVLSPPLVFGIGLVAMIGMGPEWWKQWRHRGEERAEVADLKSWEADLKSVEVGLQKREVVVKQQEVALKQRAAKVVQREQAMSQWEAEEQRGYWHEEGQPVEQVQTVGQYGRGMKRWNWK